MFEILKKKKRNSERVSLELPIHIASCYMDR